MTQSPPGAETSEPEPATSHIDELLAGITERGFVTSGEIFAAFPDLEPETAELAEIYETIRARGITVVDEIAEELQREDARRAGRVDTHEPSIAEPRRVPETNGSAAPARPGAVPD